MNEIVNFTCINENSNEKYTNATSENGSKDEEEKVPEHSVFQLRTC